MKTQPPQPPRGKKWKFVKEFENAGWFGLLRRQQREARKGKTS